MYTKRSVFNSVILAAMIMSSSFALYGQIFEQSDIEKQFFAENAHYENNTSDVRILKRQARFEGGQEGLDRYLDHNFVYPRAAIQAGIEGEMRVKFSIDSEGQVHSPEMITSVDPLLDRALIKAVENMPRWKPAIYNGAPVECSVILPFRATLR